MAETGSSIVTSALKKAGILGVGRQPTAMDSNDALSDLNDMIGEWAVQRWLNIQLLLVSKVSTGASEYTMGPGGDIDLGQAPNRIESAFQRQLNVSPNLPVDTPLKVIPAAEEFDLIALKTLKSFGLYCFLQTDYPLAKLKLYPVPNASIYEIFVRVKNNWPVYTLNTQITLPRQYIPAMKFNLARRLRQAYGKGMKPDLELNRLASNALNVIKDANIQIPELNMPDALVKNSGYNIFSDQYGSTG